MKFLYTCINNRKHTHVKKRYKRVVCKFNLNTSSKFKFMYKQVTYKYRHFEVVVIFQMQETRVPEYFRADEKKIVRYNQVQKTSTFGGPTYLMQKLFIFQFFFARGNFGEAVFKINAWLPWKPN